MIHDLHKQHQQATQERSTLIQLALSIRGQRCGYLWSPTTSELEIAQKSRAFAIVRIGGSDGTGSWRIYLAGSPAHRAYLAPYQGKMKRHRLDGAPSGLPTSIWVTIGIVVGCLLYIALNWKF